MKKALVRNRVSFFVGEFGWRENFVGVGVGFVW